MDIAKELQLLKLQNKFLLDEICCLTHEHYRLIEEKENIKYELFKRVRFIEHVIDIDGIDIERPKDDFYMEQHISILNTIKTSTKEVISKIHQDFRDIKVD